MKWKTVEKDGMPSEEGHYLIMCMDFYHDPMSVYFMHGHFTVDLQNLLFPSPLPIVATHYFRLADIRDEEEDGLDTHTE